MEIKDKIVVVTGGGSGIGAALCRRFAQDGARGVAVVDKNEDGARAVAASIDGLALRCDVSVEAALKSAIAEIEQHFGPIDLFCSNAGVAVADPDLMDPAAAPDSAWALNWGVNLMAHVYAARALGPKMAARGSGYFLNTVSAAGLLTAAGNGTYSTTKHAAVGFAESLAIAYRGRGVGVSILCPQGVDTPMLRGSSRGSSDGAMHGPSVADGILTAEAVAGVVVEGLAAERFLILPHPEVLEYMRRKTSDYDRWLRGMGRLHQRLVDNR
jgi:NAD(P)-dependent dehydrogenase (short-subunit alcohol dehydrogenase family)